MKSLRFVACWWFVQGTLLVVLAVGAVSAEERAPFTVMHADAVSHGDKRQELVGNVAVKHDSVELSAGRMVYDASAGTLEAWGAVRITDPDFTLHCARLTYATKAGEAVAWGEPRLVQQEKRDDVVFETTLSGVQIRVYAKERRVQVLEDVVLTRFRVTPANERSVELRVRCRSMDALSMARRSTFKGDVVVDTPAVGARGNRGIYDQGAGTFYLLGQAAAWNYATDGKAVNRIEGDKIVYFTKEKRTVVIGNVTADVEPEAKTGDRTIPVRLSPVAVSERGAGK